MSEMVPVSLESISGGAILEAVDAALEELVKNIQDPNTQATKVREIAVKIKVKPNEARTHAVVESGVSAKLAPQAPIITSLVCGKRNGIATAHVMVGAEIEDVPLPLNVEPIRKEAK